VIATAWPASSATSLSSAAWIGGVTSSSVVNSEASAVSRKPPAQRLGRDHLAACGDDQALERAEKAARVAVGRDDRQGRFEVVERLDPTVLSDLDARLGCL
jgi:hypothetical protein